MSLSTDELMRMRRLLTEKAEELEGEVSRQPGVGPGMKLLDKNMLADAASLRRAAALLQGLSLCAETEREQALAIIRQGYERRAA